MSIFATHRSGVPFLLLVLVASLALAAPGAQAQVDPTWDHYKVYGVSPSIKSGRMVVLRDQFFPDELRQHRVGTLDCFANPVTKMHLPQPGGAVFPINDPRLHYTWWTITEYPLDLSVAVDNQFGSQTLRMIKSLFLLNPALKNEAAGTQLPVENHYRCYECEGPPVNRVVRLVDQFNDPFDFNVTFPRVFCNPTAKQVDPPSGPIFPIVDPNQHYVCYDLEPQQTTIYPAQIRDQFMGNTQVELSPSKLLCVPTDKTGVTKTESETWGRLKLLYR